MTPEEPELLTDIRDFTSQFYVILRRKLSESDLGMRFAIWRVDLASHDFASFKHCFYCKNRSFKKVSYFLIFVIRGNEIILSVNRDPLFLGS